MLRKSVLAVLLLLPLAGCNLAAGRQAIAEVNLQRFAQTIGKTPAGCVGDDSDANHRVSCTVVGKDGVTQPVECEYRQGGGCNLDTRTKISTPYKP